MASKNLVILIGNLGADPQIRYTPGGDAVANINLATTDRYKDKQSGEWKEVTEWHRCAAFGRQAEIIGEYLKKGSSIYLEGKLRTRKYQAQDGTDRYSTEVRIESFQMLGGRSGNGGQRGDEGGNSGGYERTSESASRGNRGAGRPARPAGMDATPPGEFDDDIPFAPPYRGMQLLCCA